MKKMNDDEFRKAERMFKGFRGTKIDMETLERAQAKANCLEELAGDFMLTLKMVKDSIFGNFNLTPGELTAFIGAIIYVVSPIDAIPDFIPMLGYGDDIAILGMVLNKGASALNRYKSFMGY